MAEFLIRGQEFFIVIKLWASSQELRPQILNAELFVYVPGNDLECFSPISFLGSIAAEDPKASLLGADRDQEIGKHVNDDEKPESYQVQVSVRLWDTLGWQVLVFPEDIVQTDGVGGAFGFVKPCERLGVCEDLRVRVHVESEGEM